LYELLLRPLASQKKAYLESGPDKLAP
jgi:hypothetical protein